MADARFVRFMLKVDVKAWEHFVDRMRRRGLKADSDAELLEIVFASLIGDVELPDETREPSLQPETTSIMLTSGRLSVEKLAD